MAEVSTIEWTDSTWNIVTGCSMVSPGCTNCYAMKLAASRLRNHPSRQGLTRKGKWTGEVRFNEQWLEQPLKSKKPKRIFVCAHGDLFHEKVPFEWIDAVFAVMALAPQHIFQVLTKRPYIMRDYMADRSTKRCDGRGEWVRKLGYDGPLELVGNGWPLPNVWMGTSIENDHMLHTRLPILLDTLAAVHFISAEPLLEYIDITPYIGPTERPDWVICGGESGPGARDMDPKWARALRDQCHLYGVAFFMKQMAHKAQIPMDLWVRQYPHA